jgi:spore germination protein
VRSKLLALAFALITVSTPSFAAYRFSAWVPTWDPNALTSMQLHAGSLDESNPGWFSLNAGGAIVKNWNADDPSMRAAMSGTRLLPTVKNYVNGDFDGQLVASLIATPDAREAHAEALAQLVTQNGYDGIDVDYELVPASAKTNFTAFIQLLAQKLHASNKQLSVTLAAKTSDAQTWAGPGGNDWTPLGNAADWIKIMAYDKHYPGGAPGAITPLDWLDAVVTYAESHAPARKVMVGLPWYGYDWLDTSATDVTFASGTSRANSLGITPSRDGNGEVTFSYNGHIVFFQDAQSYAAKVDAVLAKHKGIAGFAHWRVGSEDPATWTKIASLRSGGSTSDGGTGTGSGTGTGTGSGTGTGGGSGVTPVPTDFLVNGPDALAVTAGDAATASFTITPINSYNETTVVQVQAIDPIDASLKLSNGSIRPNETLTLTVAPGKSVAAGTYRLRVRFTSTQLTKDAILDVNVAAAPPARGRAARH